MPNPKLALIAHFSRINGVVHDSDPALESGHLEEGDVGVAHVVERDPAVHPLGVVLREARLNVRHDFGAHSLASDQVHTLC